MSGSSKYMIFIPWLLLIGIISFIWALYGMGDHIRRHARHTDPDKSNRIEHKENPVTIDNEGTVIQL